MRWSGWPPPPLSGAASTISGARSGGREGRRMRLWSLHPSLLDRAGLLALWREALLAQRVLLGQTKGYRFHPQLERFRSAESPVAAIATYLWGVYREAGERGYHFDVSKIAGAASDVSLPVTRGQLKYEAEHL